MVTDSVAHQAQRGSVIVIYSLCLDGSFKKVNNK